MKRADADLGTYLDEVVYPALFEKLDTAFPEFDWKRSGRNWTATRWPGTFPFPVEHENPERLMVYADRPWWVKLHGHAGVRFLDLVSGGRKPVGPAFVEAVRKLAGLAGVSFPERDRSPEELKRLHKREARRTALEAVIAYAQPALWSPAGEAALRYLTEERGFTEEDLVDLGLGYYDTVANVRAALTRDKQDLQAAMDAGLLWEPLEGYVLIPWADATGQPLTLYGRWATKAPPEGQPKTIALPGEGTKGSPLYYDRARKAGHQDLVAVEGVFDAALLQVRGDTRVVAYVAAQFSGLQVETLVRHKVRSVVICPDPDGGGDRGALASVAALTKAGIRPYVTPRLPDGLDPDEFLLRDGLDGWKAFVNRAVPGGLHQASSLIGNVNSNSPVMDRDRVVDEVLASVDSSHLTQTDQDAVIELLAERTGYSVPALADMEAERREARRRKDVETKHRRAYEGLVSEADRLLQEGNLEAVKALLRDEPARLRQEERALQVEPPRSLAEELEAHEQYLELYRGAEFIGLPQKTLPKLDTDTLGLRGLMLLAAAPNVGKTTLAVQWGVDVVRNNADACFLFLSLEMLRGDILSKVKCRHAELDWATLVFGSDKRRGRGEGAFFTSQEQERLRTAEQDIAQWGDRVLILDQRNCPSPTVETVLEHLAALKARTGASKGFLLVDYLQVFPIPPALARTVRSDLDADKWRIGAMKDLRDATKDAVLVISESRKPDQKGGLWGGSMEDVMGSARGSYTPDMVFLLRAFSAQELAGELVETKTAGKVRENALVREAAKVRCAAEKAGRAYTTLRIAKGRDGVLRGEHPLTFHFKQSRFTAGTSTLKEDQDKREAAGDNWTTSYVDTDDGGDD